MWFAARSSATSRAPPVPIHRPNAFAASAAEEYGACGE
jgi:hypothetical protein